MPDAESLNRPHTHRGRALGSHGDIPAIILRDTDNLVGSDCRQWNLIDYRGSWAATTRTSPQILPPTSICPLAITGGRRTTWSADQGQKRKRWGPPKNALQSSGLARAWGCPVGIFNLDYVYGFSCRYTILPLSCFWNIFNAERLSETLKTMKSWVIIKSW